MRETGSGLALGLQGASLSLCGSFAWRPGWQAADFPSWQRSLSCRLGRAGQGREPSPSLQGCHLVSRRTSHVCPPSEGSWVRFLAGAVDHNLGKIKDSTQGLLGDPGPAGEGLCVGDARTKEQP